MTIWQSDELGISQLIIIIGQLGRWEGGHWEETLIQNYMISPEAVRGAFYISFKAV